MHETLDSILPLLSAAEWQIRCSALEQLGDLGANAPLEPIVTVLHTDPHSSVQRTALQTLAKLRTPAALEALIAATHDPHLDGAAIMAMASLRDHAPMDILLTCLQNPEQTSTTWHSLIKHQLVEHIPVQVLPGLYEGNGELRDNLLRHLGMVGTRLPLDFLTRIISETYNPSNREQIALVLSQFQDEDQQANVIEMASAGFWGTQENALRVLGMLHHDVPVALLLQFLYEGDNNLSSIATEALASAADYVPRTTLLALLHHEHARVRADVLAVLAGRSDDPPLDEIIRALKDPDIAVREAANSFCKEHDTGIPSTYLIDATTDISDAVQELPPPTRSGPQRHPTECKEPTVSHPLPVLLTQLQHQNESERYNALTALQHHLGVVPIEAVIAMLDDRSIRVRCAAVKWLRVHVRPFPVVVFRTILADPDDWVRRELLEYLDLEEFGLTGVISDVMACLEDPDPWNRLWALDVLKKPGIIEQVPVNFFVQATGTSYFYDDQLTIALDALRTKDPRRAIEQAILALGHKNRFVCEMAFEILQELRPELIPEIVREAIAVLNGDEPGCFFASLNAALLAELIGYGVRVSPRLIARLNELLAWPYWRVRCLATRSLGMLRQDIPEATLQCLSVLCDDPVSPAVRRQARETLENIYTRRDGKDML